VSGPDNRPVVLLVTPDEFDLYPLSTYLAQEGFLPQRAAPDDVIAALDVVRPDLILLSQLVDDRAGLDVCTQVTGRSAAPVVILAGWDSDDVEQGLNGADHYVVWPQRRREMVARLRAVVRRVRSRDMVDRAVSTGRCKDFGESFGWCHPAEGLSRSVVEHGGVAVEVGGGELGEVGPFGQPLA
jgi:DNA-binding response OmpR family regulator